MCNDIAITSPGVELQSPKLYTNADHQRLFTFAQNWQKRRRTQRAPAAWLNFCKMSTIEHFSACGTLHHVVVKTKELTLKQTLSVPCPTCGAETEEPCELHTGALRTEPHRDRKLSAADALETKHSKR